MIENMMKEQIKIIIEFISLKNIISKERVDDLSTLL